MVVAQPHVTSSACGGQQQQPEGWRFVHDTILPGYRRAHQWVQARTPTVHWGPISGKAVGGPIDSTAQQTVQKHPKHFSFFLFFVSFFFFSFFPFLFFFFFPFFFYLFLFLFRFLFFFSFFLFFFPSFLSRTDHILCTHCSPLKGQRKHNMVAEHCSGSAEDMRALLERIGGMERALIEQQARADQASTALQALQHQQQQSATTAQQAQRRAAAAQAAGAGASAVVDTRLLSLEVVQVPVRGLLRSHRQSPQGHSGFGRDLGRRCGTSTWILTREPSVRSSATC